MDMERSKVDPSSLTHLKNLEAVVIEARRRNLEEDRAHNRGAGKKLAPWWKQ